MTIFDNRRFQTVSLKVLLLAGLCLFAGGVMGETRLELEETRITGARELPKVLYIVPWRDSVPRLEPLEPRSLLGYPLQALDREVFQRHHDYRKHSTTLAPATE